jgi:hypothetical protein
MAGRKLQRDCHPCVHLYPCVPSIIARLECIGFILDVKVKRYNSRSETRAHLDKPCWTKALGVSRFF